MVNAISKQKPDYASSSELIERVKLLTCSILKSESVKLIGMFAPDLLNLTLFAVIYENSPLNQKRLLMEDAFQIVQAFDSSDL